MEVEKRYEENEEDSDGFWLGTEEKQESKRSEDFGGVVGVGGESEEKNGESGFFGAASGKDEEKYTGKVKEEGKIGFEGSSRKEYRPWGNSKYE